MYRLTRIAFRDLFVFLFMIGVFANGSTARAQTITTVDALWAWDWEGVFACSDPLSDTDLSNCFGPFSPSYPTGQMITTDGTNVYTISPTKGWGYSCPIAGPGLNNSDCTQILVGPFNLNNFDSNQLNAIVAANGYIWTAQQDGTIWRCPNNVPWNGSIPNNWDDINVTGCELLDDAGDRYPTSLALVGDILYVGLAPKDGSKGSPDGLIWSCSSMTENACKVLNNSGTNNFVYTLTVGAGYLWAGLGNDAGGNGTGILWRCDLVMANSCSTWDNAGSYIYISGIAYDGKGTLGVVTAGSGPVGVLWSCPTSNPNACNTLVRANKSFYGFFQGVAAAEGKVWGSAYIKKDTNSYNIDIYSGSRTVYSQTRQTIGAPSLLYIPAGGVNTSNTASVNIPLTGTAAVLDKLCNHRKYLPAKISVQGPYSRVSRNVNLCRFRNAGQAQIQFGALDDGWYSVSVSVGSHRGSETFYLGKNVGVKEVTVNTVRWRR